MALSNFLTEGSQIPEGSAVTSVTKQTVLPAWYTDYATQMLSGQKALSANPYPTYQGPRIADFTPTQTQGQAMTMGAAGSYQSPLNAAIGAAAGATGTSAAAAAQPYFNAATSFDPAASAASDFGAARNLTAQGASTSGLALAAPFLNQAGSIDAPGAASGDLNAARNLIGQAGNASSLGAAQPLLTTAAGINAGATAQPYLTGAVNTATGAANSGGGLAVAQPYLDGANTNTTDVSAYMNPYTDQVVNRIAELGTRNLNENIMPGIEGRYIGAGQLGYGPANGSSTPSGMMTDTARAIRDTNSDILGKQSEALQSGYTTATQTALADANRRAQLASTAGGLGTANQSAQMTAAGIQANAGSTLGSLDQSRQGALTSLGSATGELATADANRTLSAADRALSVGNTAGSLAQGQQGALTALGSATGGLAANDATHALSAGGQMLNVGNATAGLSADQQKLLASMGVNVGNLTTSDANTALSGADKLGGLASLSQGLGLTGANAVTGVGKEQQTLNQSNLDVAYQDFLRQQGYPQSQIDAMLKTFQGVSAAVPTATTEEGIVPSGQSAQYQPSTASQIASGLTGAAGLLAAIKAL